jgi:hypothetical protein
MELRTHGIALLGPIEDDPGDAVLFFDFDRLINLLAHTLYLPV